ncbi:hypothetical protein B0H16DRAFT_414819 [Mycena metata]|uniref:Uncharacterized protein n=1 Tax=Mycena metata TaxID=1033252 RepID=A0AAD7JHY9_9AGAR|nr:hypothetical protein B0H16DRAFT_414819 [Mycena metata]
MLITRGRPSCSRKPLSGRVLHVCHYLPVQATLNRSHSPDDAPLMPPPETDLFVLEEKGDDVWTLVSRYGHAVMLSGIRSLAVQRSSSAAPAISSLLRLLRYFLFYRIAVPPLPRSRSPVKTLLRRRTKLEEALGTYQPAKSDRDGDRKTVYVPVWLGDAVAHGCYDGYCKQTLWPLFHHFLWRDIASKDTSQETHYAAANQAFAERIRSVWMSGAHLHPLLLPPPPPAPPRDHPRRARLLGSWPLCVHVTRRS